MSDEGNFNFKNVYVLMDPILRTLIVARDILIFLFFIFHKTNDLNTFFFILIEVINIFLIF